MLVLFESLFAENHKIIYLLYIRISYLSKTSIHIVYLLPNEVILLHKRPNDIMD